MNHARIEAQLRNAADWLQPSEDLRPRVIESTRAEYSQHRDKQLVGYLLVLSLCAAFLSPLLLNAVWDSVDAMRSPSSGEISMWAQHHAKDPRVGADWGLFEAFEGLRQFQAHQLGLADYPQGSTMGLDGMEPDPISFFSGDWIESFTEMLLFPND